MDYSQLSDFEINKRVAVALGHSIDEEKYGNASVGAFHSDGVVYKSHDYCNNPADAWPIIVKNRISIINLDEDEWGARGVADRNSKRAIHENSLRAAMIVFLMMQESQHA